MFFLMFVPFNDPSDVLCEAPTKLSDVSLMFSLMLKFPLSFRLKLLSFFGPLSFLSLLSHLLRKLAMVMLIMLS